MLTTKQRLSQLATVFRHALMVCPKDNFSVYQRKRLRCFPKQCCDVASLLLAYHLRGQGFLKVERVFGRLCGSRLMAGSLISLRTSSLAVTP
jgi:hypothetical protein